MEGLTIVPHHLEVGPMIVRWIEAGGLAALHLHSVSVMDVGALLLTTSGHAEMSLTYPSK